MEIHKFLRLSVIVVKRGSREYNILSLWLAYKIVKKNTLILELRVKLAGLSFKFLVVEITEETFLK